jgi:uncharacterized protein YcbK (DUF882 family)
MLNASRAGSGLERGNGLKAAWTRPAQGACRPVAAALFSVFLAACSSTSEPSLSLNDPSLAASGAAGMVAGDSVGDASGNAADDKSAAKATTGEADAELPEKAAYLPPHKSGDDNPAVASTKAALEPTEKAATEAETPAAAAADESDKLDQSANGGAALKNGGPILTAGVMPDAPAIEPKKKSFLSAFFGASPASAAPAPSTPRKAKPLITLASAEPAEAKPVRAAAFEDGNMDSLPGVRQNALFEIKRKSGIDDESDVDLHEDEDGPPVLLASAAGLARLAPNGLLRQRENVDVACLKPSLVRVLKTAERHFGKKMVVTSGYRSPTYNRKVRGARNSQHMYCAAADVQMPGVSKWELAEFVRRMPGRGGVGTYCHTESVHIDVGPERDWNWRCRRRS